MNVSLIIVIVLAVTTGTVAAQTPIAIVNGHAVTDVYVNQQLGKLSLGDQITVRADLDKFVESLIREEMLFQSMIASDFEAEEDLRDEVKSIVVNHLIKKYVTDQIQVTPADVKAFYENNESAVRGEVVDVSQILRAERSECESMQSRVNQGESFSVLAGQFSEHAESATNGGALGYFMDHDGPLGFEQTVFRMQPGEMAIFETNEGCHLIKVNERIIPPIPPFENVAGQIEFLLRRQQEIDLLRALVEGAESRVSVQWPE